MIDPTSQERISQQHRCERHDRAAFARHHTCHTTRSSQNPAALLAVLATFACSDIGTQDTSPPVGSATSPMPSTTDGFASPGLGSSAGPTAPGPNGTSVPSGVPSGPEPVAGPGPNGECVQAEVVAPKRLVRLTFNQLTNSVESLLGRDLAAQLRDKFEIPAATERTFPPLNNPREGSVIIDAQWQTGDALARDAAQYVTDNFETLSGCGAAPTEDCARGYADEFARRAYRRPLNDDEQLAYSSVFTKAVGGGASAMEAVYASVYAALSAPQFLYRTEFGTDSALPGALSPYETASLLSYFLTDAPPDDELLDAAANDQLTTEQQIDGQVVRILETPQARENLQAAMFAYFGISKLNTIVVDPDVAPRFTEGLRASMMRETELFINDTLWDGDVTQLLTSRQSFVNEGLADLYEIPFPPSGAELDDDGFAKATLPDNRAGILTQPGYLTTRSSPEKPSVVRRGLLVNASLLCATNPPFPEAQAEAIDAVNATLAGASEREKAEFRASSTECKGCHLIFDSYGLALDNFDVIGAYRTSDPEDRTIDATVTLPDTAGGATVTSAAQMAQELVETGAFTRCVAKNLISYALAEGSRISASSCATRMVTGEGQTMDQSFGALVRGVARSTTFLTRNAGADQ